MKVDFNIVLKKFNGKPLFIEEIRNGKLVETAEFMTLRFVTCEALAFETEEDKPSQEEKMKRFKIAEKIVDAGDGLTEITNKQAELILSQINKRYNMMVLGQAARVLEKEEEVKEKE